MLGELEGYLNKKGWKYKEVRERSGLQVVVLDDCPFCGKPKHLYFNAEDGRWDCKRCGERGNLLVMKNRLGDLELKLSSASDIIKKGMRRHDPLGGERPARGIDLTFQKGLFAEKGKKALEYMTEVRGFSEDIIKKFNIGYTEKAGQSMISIPHYYGGELVNVKFRTLPPSKKMFTRWAGCPSVLFNGDSISSIESLPPRERFVFLCEGETDAMAMVQYGFNKSIASSAGAGSWPEHWLKSLESVSMIYIVYDNDDAGDAGAEKVATVLGKYRCKRVKLPLHDVAECQAAGLKKEDIAKAIKESADFGDRSVRVLEDFAEDLKKNIYKPEPKGNSTGWVTLDAIIGGVRDGESTIVTGDTGSGKSTWVIGWARNQALQSKPVLIAPFEQRPFEVLGKLVSMHSGEGIYDIPRREIDEQLKRTCSLPIYFLDRQGPTPLADIKDAVYLSVMKFGIQRVILDHLHFSLVCRSRDERQAIKEYMQQVEMWAKDLDIHIMVVVHPKNLGVNYKTGKTRKVELDDLKGASDLKQITDNAIRVFRYREDSHGTSEDKTEIAVMKCRSSAGSEGAAWYYFDANSERYIDGAYPPKERKEEGSEAWDIPI